MPSPPRIEKGWQPVVDPPDPPAEEFPDEPAPAERAVEAERSSEQPAQPPAPVEEKQPDAT
jgi:hypothetical protein